MPFLQRKSRTQKVDYRSLTWYLTGRAAVITFMIGGVAIFYLRGSVENTYIVPLFLLMGVSYAQTFASLLLLRLTNRLVFFAQAQIVWDLLVVTFLILLTGGVESIFSFAYLLLVVAASFLLTRQQTVFAAASAAILFGGLLDLQYFDYLESFNLYRSVPDSAFLSAVFVHVVAFLLTAILSGTLAERWRSASAELETKKADFAELEMLNRTILAHISSGLMLVGPDGRILSFNRAASEITGLGFGKVYNLPVKQFFPDIPLLLSSGYNLVTRAEGFFTHESGERMVLGYATTIARGSEGEDLGLLVTFQDLTQLKKVEEELQRADRLAAVGRLASGMAHEIRNPLASISGSVQLLLEADHVAPGDRRLMSIVVREAERLSGLLTDFLTYARPKPPVKSEVDICSVLDELIEMLKRDSRFENIVIRKRCTDVVSFYLDRTQIWQILWDLAINALEAMGGDGELHFKVDINKRAITVEDSGPGIAEEIRNRIFDPFFSTKEKGSGLGLASVYSVMDAHGGHIDVSPGELGGARFTLIFSE